MLRRNLFIKAFMENKALNFLAFILLLIPIFTLMFLGLILGYGGEMDE